MVQIKQFSNIREGFKRLRNKAYNSGQVMEAMQANPMLTAPNGKSVWEIPITTTTSVLRGGQNCDENGFMIFKIDKEFNVSNYIHKVRNQLGRLEITPTEYAMSDAGQYVIIPKSRIENFENFDDNYDVAISQGIYTKVSGVFLTAGGNESGNAVIEEVIGSWGGTTLIGKSSIEDILSGNLWHEFALKSNEVTDKSILEAQSLLEGFIANSPVPLSYLRMMLGNDTEIYNHYFAQPMIINMKLRSVDVFSSSEEVYFITD